MLCYTSSQNYTQFAFILQGSSQKISIYRIVIVEVIFGKRFRNRAHPIVIFA